MQKYEQAKTNLKKIVINNFIGGIAWAIGATIGASIILAILGFALSKINLIPIIGDFVSQINDYVLQNKPQLVK